MPILIAEDDVTSRTMVETLLDDQGWNVIEATDGEEAWEILQRPEPPRMAIIDWMMPGIDGPELCERVRQLDSERPPYIIMLTMREEKEDIVEGLRAGADDYLTKPYDPDELRARIHVGWRIIKMQDRLIDKNRKLQNALDTIKTLRGLIPICANCKKVRDDDGYWQEVEGYVRDHSQATFSHGICPECMEELYPEYAAKHDAESAQATDG